MGGKLLFLPGEVLQTESSIYCRATTQAQRDGDHALEAQSAWLHENAGRNEYEIMGEVRAYEKGITLDRDGWKAFCRLAAEKKAGLIRVTQLDRVTRDMWLLLQALSALAEKGIWLQSINQCFCHIIYISTDATTAVSMADGRL